MNYTEFYKEVGLTTSQLETYTKESIYKGYPTEPGGSVWEQEGKSIFNLIRHLKPKHILEIGNFKGVSSNHILQAVEKNGIGQVTLVDIYEFLDYDRIHNRNFNRVLNDSLKFLSYNFEADFIVLDGCHEYEHVKKELELIYENNLSNEYYLWVHDYFTEERSDVGVKSAWDEFQAIKKPINYKVNDDISNCGFVFSKIIK